ncbi:MAG: sulfite exporter TauE/SafE family protein, partial [Pseudonocardiaceae bacterium]
MQFPLVVVGLTVGFLVGLMGMGGGAVLTPLLVLSFRFSPLVAISSDLLTSLVMMPVGAAVHLRHGTVNWWLVRWLVLGSVPAAVAGSVLIGSIGHAPGVQADLRLAIGVALCASVVMTLLRQLLDRRSTGEHDNKPLVVRPLRTVAIGVVGGFAVGMTSVGGGSLISALLLIAYPRVTLASTVIVQAIPLVAAATVGHLLYGEVHLAVVSSLLVGALPGVYL